MSFPHARGDEPKSAAKLVEVEEVFPTHVGMNRAVGLGPEHQPVFPTLRIPTKTDTIPVKTDSP